MNYITAPKCIYATEFKHLQLNASINTFLLCLKNIIFLIIYLTQSIVKFKLCILQIISILT